MVRAAAEVVPDLAVVRRWSARTVRSTSPKRNVTFSVRHNAPQLSTALDVPDPRRGILRRQMRFDPQRRVNLSQRLLVRLGERIAPRSPTYPSSRAQDVHAENRNAPLERRVPADSYTRRLTATPSRIQIAASAEPRHDQRQRDEHRVQPQQAVLKLRHHRRRRVARRTLPHAALDRREEIDDPRADGHAERQDRRRRRMFGERRRSPPRARSSARRSARVRPLTSASSGA